MRKLQLDDWLARGLAQPDLEPWASFARDYLAAEAMQAPIINEALSQQVAHVVKIPPAARTPAEVEFLRRELAARFPLEHGNAASGNGQLRMIDPEPDAEAWWQKHGLVGDQLRALMRDPPESVAAAQLAEAKPMVLRMLRDGWVPDAEVLSALGAKGKK